MNVWGHFDLTRALKLQRRGWPLKLIGEELGYPPAEVDQALWAKLGRTIPQAIDVISAKAGRAA
jgi:hypothetical protein